MEIQIPDNWLRDFLKTKASVKEIAKFLSLCGPSVERIKNTPSGPVYSIEVTTNRVDSASVYGIAREASAILPRFGIKAVLKKLESKIKPKFTEKVGYLAVKIDHNLCPRFTAVLIKNVKVGESPSWLKERLISAGSRPINNVVDISNYIMYEIGQPVHTFDYDKIGQAKMTLRESGKGEKVTTLDGRAHTLFGGDIVIEDGDGKLIDLCGIMGGQNSAVGQNTKNVLLFVQNYNPVKIRRTSMRLAQRTEAAMLFEKGLDSELVEIGIIKGIELFEKLTGGTSEKEILNLYPQPDKIKFIGVTKEIIDQKLGIEISKQEISKILTSLGFEPIWKKKSLLVKIPSFRANDMEAPEDLIEEIARLYGYHNFPGILMSGVIPNQPEDTPFTFEDKIKNILKGYGACEIYTLSLVPFNPTFEKSLRLKNPLGKESEYLRNTLISSVAEAAKVNAGEKEPFHLFEMANVYLPKIGDLPLEKMTLAGILANTGYREAKGVVESLLAELNIKADYILEDLNGYLPSHRVAVKTNGKVIGELGTLTENGFIYYEFDLEALRKTGNKLNSYQPISQNPPQIEDVTLSFPEKTKIGEVIKLITNNSKLITRVELRDIYQDSYTFRVWYQHPSKTLTNIEVESIRKRIISLVRDKFGGQLKD